MTLNIYKITGGVIYRRKCVRLFITKLWSHICIGQLSSEPLIGKNLGGLTNLEQSSIDAQEFKRKTLKTVDFTFPIPKEQTVKGRFDKFAQLVIDQNVTVWMWYRKPTQSSSVYQIKNLHSWQIFFLTKISWAKE